MNNILIKKAQFYYSDNPINRFQKKFENINGYGTISLAPEEKLVLSTIDNPSGFASSMMYQTGRLTGNISTNVGFFTWNNISITGTGSFGDVYLNYITGYKPASTTIYFDENYLSKLVPSDFLNINNINFNFVTGTPQNLFEFNTFEHLVNILNSGSLGVYSNIDNGILQNTVGISGKIEGFSLILTSIARSGENGNSNRIYRDCQDLSAITIPNRYFTGGETLRPLSTDWSGVFTNFFDVITVENSGFYNSDLNSLYSLRTQDVAWENNFSGNYIITTGIFSSNNTSPSQGLLMFNTGLGKYYGNLIIPSGSSRTAYTGVVLNINKPNPYNLTGNIAKYIINGEYFIFSGLIEG